MGLISKQPNGLYCRISTVVDAPTFYNASKADLEEYLKETQQLDPYSVDEWLEKYGHSFEYAKKRITTLNMTQKEINSWIEKVSTDAGEMEYC